MKRISLVIASLFISSVSFAAWTVIVDDVVQQNGATVVRVTLTDGVQKIRPDEYRVSSENELQQKLNAAIAQLTSSQSTFFKIPKGVYDPNPTPTPKTQPDIDRDLYIFYLGQLRQWENAKAVGAATGLESDYLIAKDWVAKKFLLSYLDLF